MRVVDFRLENRRQAYLDALYLLDGRDSPVHPAHSTYTGLVEQRRRHLMAEDFERLAPTAPSQERSLTHAQ